MLKESFVGYVENGVANARSDHKKVINQRLPGHMNAANLELQNEELVKHLRKVLRGICINKKHRKFHRYNLR